MAKTPADRFNPVAQFAAALGGTGADQQGDTGSGTPIAARSSRQFVPWAIALAATLGLIWLGNLRLLSSASVFLTAHRSGK